MERMERMEHMERMEQIERTLDARVTIVRNIELIGVRGDAAGAIKFSGASAVTAERKEVAQRVRVVRDDAVVVGVAHEDAIAYEL